MLIILLTLLFATDVPAAEDPISPNVRENIRLRVVYQHFPSIAIGVIAAEGTTYATWGEVSSGVQADELSVYEIGSISKVFTGILLADQVIKGTLKLDTPVQSLLPTGVSAPLFDGHDIQLFHLSTHSSGLPRMPDNFNPANPANPYVDYSEQLLFEFLTHHKMRRAPGSDFEYSNYAVGLLGHLLAQKSGSSYPQLVQETIAKPLAMKMTAVTLTPEMRKHLAPPTSNGVVVSLWDLTTLAGAGGIRSNVQDMCVFIKANMGMVETDLRAAMDLSHQQHYQAPNGTRIGLGWHIKTGDPDIIWHNGGTGGYRTFAGFTADHSKGVVVLTNSTRNSNDIGFHLLDATNELAIPKKSLLSIMAPVLESDGIKAAQDLFYKLRVESADSLEFRETDFNNLGYEYLANGDLEKAIAIFALNVEAFPEGFNTYDSLAEAYMVNGQNELAIANYNKSLALNPGNDNARAKLAELGQATEAEHQVAAATLKDYQGTYQLTPQFSIYVTVEGNQLFAQATGQQRFQVFPESDNLFYYKVVEAKLEFHRDQTGSVNAMTLHQNGKHRGERVK